MLKSQINHNGQFFLKFELKNKNKIFKEHGINGSF